MKRLHSLACVLLLLALALPALTGCGDSPPPPAKTADELVNRVAQGLAEDRPVVLWDALPDSYQKDITGLVHAAAAKMDPAMWDPVFEILQRISKLASSKKKFILNHPAMADLPNKADIEKNWDHVVNLFGTLAFSELSKLEKVRVIDLRDLMSGTGSKLMMNISALTKTLPDERGANEFKEGWEALKKMKATTVKESGDSATIKLEAPGKPTTEVEFTRVEGKWIPAEMAKDFKKGIAEARKAVDDMKPEQIAQSKAMMMPILGAVGGALKSLEDASTQEEFNTAVDGLGAMVQGAAMNLMGGGRRGPGPSPFPADPE